MFLLTDKITHDKAEIQNIFFFLLNTNFLWSNDYDVKGPKKSHLARQYKTIFCNK